MDQTALADRICLIRVKIERAKKHLIEFEAEVVRFRDQKLSVVFTDVNCQIVAEVDPQQEGRSLRRQVGIVERLR
jgi:hypothetical protein